MRNSDVCGIHIHCGNSMHVFHTFNAMEKAVTVLHRTEGNPGSSCQAVKRSGGGVGTSDAMASGADAIELRQYSSRHP